MRDHRSLCSVGGLWRRYRAVFLALSLVACTAGDGLVSLNHWGFGPPAATLAQPPSPEVEQLLRLGAEQLTQKRYQAASQTYQRVLGLLPPAPKSEFQTQATIGLARAKILAGDPTGAIEPLQRIIAQAENNSIRAFWQTTMAIALSQLGRYSEAEQQLRSAIATWENIRGNDLQDVNRITLFEQQSYTYRLLQQVLVAQKKTDAALEVAEWSRARAIVELLALRMEKVTTLSPPPTVEQLRQIARDQNSTLVEYSTLSRQPRVLGNEIEDEAELLIWVIQPNGQITFRQVEISQTNLLGNVAGGPQTVLARLVYDSRGAIGLGSRGLVFQETSTIVRATSENSSLDLKNPHLQRLYEILIAPIQDQLPRDPEAHVTFIPQGPLFLVPFAALQNPDGQSLIERHTILTSPSIQMLAVADRQKQRLPQATPWRGNAALVVGNPVMPQMSLERDQPPQQLSSLPGAEEEAKAIAPLLQTQPLLREQATKAAVIQRLGQSRVIHLATHGILDLDPNLNEFGIPNDPQAPTARQSGVVVSPGAVVVGSNVKVGGVSAEVALAGERVVRVEMPGLIALAPSGTDNGFLSAQEILNLRLQAELVVLSACNTGRGRVTGDGVVGLVRAFIAAGVPSVVVSLWAVPDAPTATLMMEFYRNLQTDGQRLNKARALRRAMLATRQQYPDPIDWAGFTLVGEAGE